MGNGSNIWEMAEVFDEWLKYVGIDLEICEISKMFGNGLDI